MRSYSKAILCLLLLASPALTQQPASGQRPAPSLSTDDAYERRMPAPQKDLRAVTRITLDIVRKYGPKESIVLRPEEGKITPLSVDYTHDGAPDFLQIMYTGEDGQWSFGFSTKGIERNLVPGSYTRCGDVHSRGVPGLTVRGNRFTSFTTAGSFNIYDVEFDYSRDQSSPTLTRLAASFKVVSSEGEARGVIYINAAPIDGLR